MNEFDVDKQFITASLFLIFSMIIFNFIIFGLRFYNGGNSLPSNQQETRYAIELRSLDGTLIDTIYPDIGTYWYEPMNIPQVVGNTVQYVSKSSVLGIGDDKYLTASAPVIIVKEFKE